MEWINGNKTYIVAIVLGIVTALHSAGLIDDNAQKLAESVLASLGLMALRSAVSNAAAAAVDESKTALKADAKAKK